MFITFFRSSSYNAWDFCPQKYFLDYTLGYHSPAGKKADKGNVVHKALELLARYKLATQQSEALFGDDDTGVFDVLGFNPELALDVAWKHIVGLTPHHDWNNRDFDDCVAWMYEALTWRGGMFSPLKREIVMPEKYFELEIKEPWAQYAYEINGEKVSGYLGLKGTIDLLVKQGKDSLEMIDWKTGLRKDWSTFQDKTYEKLQDDPQLRIYHYAASKMFPKVKNIFITIFYLQDGGPESLCFTEDDLKKTEDMLRARFNTIRNTQRPKTVYPSKKCGWCYFKKNSFDGPTDDYNKSICKTVHNDIITLGLDKVTNKYSKENVNNYGSGGGRRNDKDKVQEASATSNQTKQGN